MKQLSRVVWSEGMHLAPHHFQTQARYFEDSVHFATSALWFAGYGLVGCELDAEALTNGTVSLVHGRGIFPDGLPFHMPECDPLPEVRNIAEEFSPVSDRLSVYLGIPAYRPEAVNCVLPGDEYRQNSRYIAESRDLHDENTGRDEKPVQVGRKNIRLCLDTEITGEMIALPLARIMRDGAGHFIFDKEFIPPCLRITASERLMLIIRRLIDILEDKSRALARSPTERGEMAIGFSQQEVASFWFLHCVNSGLAMLRNLCYCKRGHPEEVFVELSRMAGALCTFGLDSHPGKLPLYDHDHLDDCFTELDQHIRFHLETLIPTNCVTIPLERTEDYMYAGEVADQRCLGRSRWIFSVRSAIGEADLISLTPKLVKICSEEFTGKLVRRALPGLTLTHMPAPPSAVSPKVEHQYFGIAKTGPCWEHIMQTKRVGVYVPGEIPAPEIGVHVVLES